MDVATRDAPGVINPFSWVTDISGPVNPNDATGIPIATNDPYYQSIFAFTLTTTYYTQASTADNAATGMTFNRMGIMGGPLKNSDGTANVGGIVTLTLFQNGGPNTFSGVNWNAGQVIAQAKIDLTSWVPGKFYWSEPFDRPVTIWGSQISPPGAVSYYFTYDISVACTTKYSIYYGRTVTLLNGNQWGIRASYVGESIPELVNTHFCSGSVDLGFFNYRDLGTASLVPHVAIAGELHRKAGLSFAPISPQVVFGGHVGRAGVFEGVSAMKPVVVLSAAPMVGGPLWRPSKLCTG